MELEARKLYVGGLPPSTQQDELMDHFGRYGEVLCVRVVRNHETGLGRGFAFVEFADDEGPRAALKEEEKDSHVFSGRTVRWLLNFLPYFFKPLDSICGDCMLIS
jgi:RNA recognition motif-containing protein